MTYQSEVGKMLSELPETLIEDNPLPKEYRDHHKPVWERKLVKDNPHLLNAYFIEKLGALKLYGDFYVEWLYARATGKQYFKWSWGKLEISRVDIFDYYKGKESEIMEFEEFYACLKTAYCF